MKIRKTFLPFLLSLILTVPIISCGKKVPLTDAQKVYAGRWVAADGTYVKIYLDGGGEMKTSNTKISGGKVTITDTSLTISMGPIKKVMRMTLKPKEAAGKWSMKLDSIEYVKQPNTE